MEERYFPSRGRPWLVGFGLVLLALSGAEALIGVRWWVGLGHAAVALSVLWSARRLGATVSDEGVRLQSRFYGVTRWPWNEIDGVDVIEEEFVRNAPPQVVLRLEGDESVRLGRLPGREALVDELRRRLA